MSIRWTILAQVFLSLAVGCANSHGMDGQMDGGGPDALRIDVGVGLDAGSIGDARMSEDLGPVEVDGGSLAVSCAPDQAEAIFCSDVVCNAPDQWHWNGHECVVIACGSCVGEACGLGHRDRATCAEAHASCAAPRCMGSGGVWRFWGLDDCAFQCGVPHPDIDCDSGAPTCDCGPDMTFLDGRCQLDDVCLTELPPLPLDVLCASTGGDWGGFCDHSSCGVPSFDPCAADACHCPWPMMFDEERGCYEAERCFRGHGGCDARSICPSGTACDSGRCEPVNCRF